MKRFITITIIAMSILLLPTIAQAQSENTFNKKTLKSTETGNVSREKTIDRKKKEESPKQPQAKQETPSRSNEFEIINPCSDWLDVEFVELVGMTSTQTATLKLKITNHDVNMRAYVGGDLLAYDELGGKHNRLTGQRYELITDVMVLLEIDIPGTMLPSKVKKFSFISFNVYNCKIEMRNVPIDWR